MWCVIGIIIIMNYKLKSPETLIFRDFFVYAYFYFTVTVTAFLIAFAVSHVPPTLAAIATL